MSSVVSAEIASKPSIAAIGGGTWCKMQLSAGMGLPELVTDRTNSPSDLSDLTKIGLLFD
jgi:hypothetical protein